MNYHHLLEAIGILVAGLLFYSYTYSWFPVARADLAAWRAMLNGLAFGAIAIVLMIARIEVGPGVFIDPRVVPIALIGLFEGWPAAFVAAVMAMVYRLWLGGSGALAGTLTVLLVGAAAGFVHAWAVRSGRIGMRHAALLAGLTYAATVAGFAVLGQRGVDLFAPVWLVYLVTMAVGVGLLAPLFRDVADQHALAAAQRRYRESLDEATDVIRIIDADTLEILDTNRADSLLSGYRRDEIVGRSARDFWPDDEAARGEREAVLDGLRERGHAEVLGAGYRTQSGAIIPIDATYRLFRHEGRRYVVVIFHPADSRIAVEGARREAAELRSVTLLARGAAHEIHNPLAVISGYLQLLRGRMSGDDKTAEWVGQMLEATGRIRDAVDRLGRITRVESTTAGRAPAMLDMARSTDAAPPTPGDSPARAADAARDESAFDASRPPR